ncbi:hypothetical protein BN7_6278 [Wickerhamomyces ciferrii]|uniref:Protein BOI2 n=1 Tax=Wickerhamomyces ciferrii (strain ATCC 14091 / BCRC 22168 / CBS 111 / JCM 3599 / NBRC 0793 / NRRL Y-1031 F-60-10) TaxID=1206466 RepID=K0KU21_WICCF|nr:uncharacterized protein BN7_6278 [Wickerhamomyces ciferrii]CCH46681.1 hypothetical protein BN7_6278 [Wickerhamomyces ciferrii]
MSGNDPRQQLPSIKTTGLEEAATGAIYQVIKEFSARLEDELTLTLGDKIEVISDDKEYNDGWYMGKSLNNGSVGLYPKSFTQLVPSLSRPSLLRSRSRRIASPNSANINNQSPVSLPSASASATPILNKSQHQFIPEEQEPIDQSFEMTPDINKKDSVNGAISDIDKALEELRNEATPNSNSNNKDRPRSYSIQSEDSLNPEQVESWTPEQVTAYFAYLGFDVNSSGQFARHKITGAILLELELAYLKELDILSFGTRFEMFKEIEALKELAHQKNLEESNGPYNKLLAPAELHSSNKTTNNRGLDDDLDTFTRPLGHARKKSQSLDDIPEISRRSNQFQDHQKFSQPQRHSLRPLSINPPSSQVPQLPQSPSQFASPRRAPNPPSYPSPIQLKEDNFNQLSPSLNKRNSFIDSTNHSRKPSYEVNTAFQQPYSHSRSNSNFKSQSVSDLLSTTHLDNGRPASSIYMDTQQNHSRKSSAQFKKGHFRGNSDASVAISSRNGNNVDRSHRRHSSVFSFLSNANFNNGGGISPTRTSPTRKSSVVYHDRNSSPTRDGFRDSHDPQRTPQLNSSTNNTPVLQTAPKLPSIDTSVNNSNDKRRSVSAKEPSKPESPLKSPAGKRSVSEAVRAKTLRNISSSTALKSKNTKKETSAFMEGIRNINPADSIKSADCFGWMSKRGGIAVGTWKQRYFTLHGTRLSYFTSLSDSRERGLIDITSHKVLPAKEDDKFVSLYAASTGHGKFCFKLVPPAPGSRKGLTFTQPKIHYFAVESKEEMRTWMAALIKATIDIDESVPIISSCATPTVSLQKAQTLLVQARENARRREDAYRQQNLVQNEPPLSQSSLQPATRLPPSSNSNENSGTSSISPDSGSFDSNIPTQSPNTTATTSEITPISQNGENGFSSPYVIASGFVSPKSNPTSANHSPIDQEFKSKPYSANTTRQPSQRISSSASAAAAAAIAHKNRISDNSNRI